MKMNKWIIHSLFEDTAEKFLANTAVEAGSRRVTYGELNSGANRIARALIEKGVGGQEIIGLYFNASIEYIAAVLGVLKAGAVFMPLNTQFPDARLSDILNKTKPRIIVADALLEKDFFNRLPGFNLSYRPDYLIILDNGGNIRYKSYPEGNIVASEDSLPAENPDMRTSPDDGCYLVTTSGSTGEPKVIQGCHKGLSHFIRWEIGEFDLNQDLRASLLSAVTFDVSLRDIFMPLCAGGTLCIPDEETRHNPERLLRWLTAERITLMHIVPTVFRLFIQQIEESDGDGEILPDLKYALIAGEALYGNDVIGWRQIFGNRVELVNLYGPSETTLAKLFYRIGNEKFTPNEIVPIGKPIPDTEALVIDDDKLSPMGETGEIYIRTPFMTKGYYGAPALNEASFVQNPLVKDREEIVYRTGDRGRLMPDGNYHFAGRLDGQVKLYGNRVEIGEIEVFLRQHPQVKDAAVTVKQDSFGDLRLAGYIVPADGQKPSIESLRRFLADRLPDYMLPAVFVTLTELPVTSSGKIDRGALPEPDRARPEMEQAYIGPATNQEKALNDLWCRVLGLEKVGTEDNFFDLGGTSVLAVRLISLVRDAFQIEMPVVILFQCPNIKAMAAYLSQSRGRRSSFHDVRERAQKRRASFSRQRLSSEGS